MLLARLPSLSINKRVLAKRMELQIKNGQAALLQGPNGCGKSLLLDILTGTYSYRKCRLEINGNRVKGSTSHGRWRAGIRRMFQEPNLPPDVLVADLLRDLGDWSRASEAWKNDSREMLSSCGVTLDRNYRDHSFGQKRLVDLVFTLSGGDYCLLDEPFAGLHQFLRLPAEKLMRQSMLDGRGLLVVDHLSAASTDLYAQHFLWPLPSVAAESGDLSVEEYLDDKPPGVIGCTWRVQYLIVAGRVVARDLVLRVSGGGILFVVGGNGAGKSTLLRELGGLPQPIDEIRRETTGVPEGKALFLSPQPPKLVKELSALENINLMLGRGSRIDRKRRELAKSLLFWLGFPQNHLEMRAEVLSGGEASMVALAGAALAKANFLLLDEPFESLDERSSQRAKQLLWALAGRGRAVIVATHHLTDQDREHGTVLELSDREIASGEIVATGD